MMVVVERVFRFGKYLKEGRFFEDGEAEDLEDCVEAGVEIEALFEDGDKQVDRHGDPDLSFDGVLGGAIEALDAQVLLDPLEEQLDLPAALVQLGDGRPRQGESVGEICEDPPALAIAVLDAAQALRVAAWRADPRWAYDLIADQAA